MQSRSVPFTRAVRKRLRGATLGWVCHGLILAALAGCSSEASNAGTQENAGATAPAAAATNPNEAIDLDTIMRRTHFGYRAEGGVFSAGHETYAVKASPEALTVWPSESDLAAPEEGATAPFIASLESITRGGRSIAEGHSGKAAVRPDASLGIQRGAVVEHLENDEEGVEQSFEFAERPTGEGDLEVKIVVTGEAFLGETEGGLHFADPATGLGVRYGVATWIDANGVRTHVDADFVDGRIVLRVPASVLDASAYPAVLDPVIGPEIAIDTPVYAAANRIQYDTVVSFAGGAFLVVWTDQRYQGTADVYGVRVSQAGTVLDTSGIPIVVAKSTQSQPAVASNGTDWMVVWTDSRNNADDIYAARVTAAGVLQDPNGIAVTSGGGKGNPSIAFDGTNYFVVHALSTQIRGNFVGTNGTVNPSTVSIAQPSNSAYDTAVSWNGTNYLVAFNSYLGANSYRVAARRVSPAGTVLDASDIVACSGSLVCPYMTLGLASDGVNWLLAWDTTTAANSIIGQRISSAGAIMDAGGFTIGNGGATSDAMQVTVTFAGNGYGVFWDDSNQAYGARVSSGGAVLVPTTPLTSEMGTRAYVSAAHDGTNFFVAFSDTRGVAGNNLDDIYGLRVSNALVKIDATSTLLSRAANDERSPRAAFNGTNWLVVWEDARPGSTNDIWGARLSSTGTVLDAAGFAISGGTNSQYVPVVAANGVDWLVAWQDRRNGSGNDDIFASRVSSAGAVLDAGGIPVAAAAGNQTNPAIAADGTNWLVTWRDTTSTEIFATRVAPSSTVLDPAGIKLSTGGGLLPAVAYNGTNYLVAWTKPTNANDIFASRVTPAGAVLDAGALAIPVSAVVGSAETNASVASNGVDWFVAWNDASDVRGARVNAAGTVLDVVGISVSSAANTQNIPATAWDGTQYWVVWQDDRTTVNYQDVYGARISSTGTNKDPSGFVVANDALQLELRPQLAAGKPQEVLAAYYRFDPQQPYGSDRARARILSDVSPGANGVACSVGAQCVSGFCVDGVCCDAACTSTCQACSAAKKGAGTDGVCGAIKVDTDPDNECTDQGASSCGTSGSCNGAAACKLYPSGASCGATCNGGALQPQTCDGAGTCAASGMPTNCAPYACAANMCKSSCTTGADCASGFSCVNGACVGLLGNGESCAASSDCQSGSCVDGVCCNTACGGLCQACTVSKKGNGTDGVCGPIALGVDPDNECATQAASSCGQTGVCNGTGACQLHPQGTSCGVSTCQGSVVTGQICNGSG
ncbi:MAG TPA: hypothetical protein VM694_26565, partial [Polyangium sp.]|nr:hypothetical protein [Polyangium sp.]